MKLGELRKLLEKYPDDTEVFAEYDSFCCVWDNFSVVDIKKNYLTKRNKYYNDGIYFCCESSEKDTWDYWKDKLDSSFELLNEK